MVKASTLTPPTTTESTTSQQAVGQFVGHSAHTNLPLARQHAKHDDHFDPPHHENKANDSGVEILQDSAPGFFEGPEKLLELWFAPSEDELPPSTLSRRGNRRAQPGTPISRENALLGLRTVDRPSWERMLDEVHCKVLSVIEGEQVDAYMLSESSMFVWPHKIILKTCGTTTLLLGLNTLLRIAAEHCGLGKVWRCFYSRKTFMFPERQLGPHRDWNQEVRFLDGVFDNGSAYAVGRINGDHWVLYLTPAMDDALGLSPKQTAQLEANTVAKSSKLIRSPTPTLGQAHTTCSLGMPPDQTLEILMSELDPEASRAFFHPISEDPLHENDDGHAAGTRVSRQVGVQDLFPDAVLDAFLFEPCGYSANAVLDDRYATIHVTPEQDWSYASFECNLDISTPVSPRDAVGRPTDNLHSLVNKVLAIFKPARFSITLFVSRDDDLVPSDAPYKRRAPSQGLQSLFNLSLQDAYTRRDRIHHEFDDYDLGFATYEHPGRAKKIASDAWHGVGIRPGRPLGHQTAGTVR
ncbi:uncharacterized protein L969DRAFT_23620 [Mixia osmundae IAM 14324]|uniref:Adenosylmethionine decarboxylase n=1 Tax=Mixia osmundae (strain CBS 9802 / IAM 14324 / JCM 22182 / KY 12970) TaxID=764103 RepID=G7E6F2_MIXOS|nr:uncharacterized protein L969DRAFT_23620 [Mixia osmundae IAM 14324]KEI40430.1 hypothetical protein L969DRAFT_23620 [Mixia osmundae IAM 14324]GAA98412.1 hypothetical protein E5Q_05098 [Mixia osmundae IAM 14324]